MPQLRNDERKFREYFRMNQSTFDDLLRYIEHSISRTETNWRETIKTEERLCDVSRSTECGRTPQNARLEASIYVGT